jgi:hypothetical protein
VALGGRENQGVGRCAPGRVCGVQLEPSRAAAREPEFAEDLVFHAFEDEGNARVAARLCADVGYPRYSGVLRIASTKLRMRAFSGDNNSY